MVSPNGFVDVYRVRFPVGRVGNYKPKPNGTLILAMRKVTLHLQSQRKSKHSPFYADEYQKITGNQGTVSYDQLNKLIDLGILEKESGKDGRAFLYNFNRYYEDPIMAYVDSFIEEG